MLGAYIMYLHKNTKTHTDTNTHTCV